MLMYVVESVKNPRVYFPQEFFNTFKLDFFFYELIQNTLGKEGGRGGKLTVY